MSGQEQPAARGQNPLQPLLVPAIAGLSGTLFWLLCMISDHLAPGTGASLPWGIAGVLTMAAAVAATLASRRFLAPRIAADPAPVLRALCVAAGALGLPLLLLHLDAVRQLDALGVCLEALGWLCVGAGAALSLVLWVNVWNILYRQENRTYAFWGQALCVPFAGALMCAAAYLAPSAAVLDLSATVAYLASAFLCWHCTKLVLPYDTAEKRNDDLPYKALERRPFEDELRMFIYCACAGAVLVALAASPADNEPNLLPMLCVGLAFLVLLARFFVNNRVIKIYYLENVSFFLMAIALLVLMACNGVNLVVLSLFAVSCFLEFVADFSCCTMTASLKRIPFAPFPAKTFANTFLGLMAGWGVGSVLAYLVPGQFLFVALAALSLAAILFDFIFIPYPVLEDDELYEYLNGLAATPKIDVKGDSQEYGGWWLYKCNAIAEEHDLTKREAEILVLLAKGKNATSIAERLVISQNTARTHIYRIYRKLGVNTHQELITYVEEKKVSS